MRQGKEQGFDLEQISAKIVNNSQKCLKRDGDEKLYSFSRLRWILTKDLSIKEINPDWGFTLNSDWITKDGKTLQELINNEG